MREVFAIILLFAIDLVWISMNSKTYNTLVSSIQGTNMRVNKVGALIAYPLMFVGLVFLVLRNADRDKSTNNSFVLALKHGALFGLVLYGVFNATNIAMFTNYKTSIALIDTMWGTFAYFVVTWAAIHFWGR